MITYITSAPKKYAPNATLVNPIVINKEVKTGEVFKYLHSGSKRATVTLVVVAPNTATLKYSVKAVFGAVLLQTLIAKSWEEASIQLNMLEGQELEMTMTSDTFVRLTALGENS